MEGTVGVWVYNKKAYVPTHAQQNGGGLLISVAPIFISDLTVEGLSEVIEKGLQQGHPIIPQVDLTKPENVSPKNHPLLEATHARSWRELEREAVLFLIDWAQDLSSIYVTDKSMHFTFDSRASIELPADTSPRIIAETVLKYLSDMSGSVKETIKKLKKKD